MSDQDTIAEVDELAWSFVNLSMPLDDALLVLGTQCHRNRTRFVRELWEQARKVYQMRTGVDVLDAIKRHEAWLRSPENAPQLYVERR